MRSHADHLGWDSEGVLGAAGAPRRGAAVARLGQGGSWAAWANPPAVKRMFNSADILRDGRVVFDIGGNKYRLVVWVNHHYGVVYVRFIGAHRTYDTIDPQTI
jgi:mRNA-degrading endonuclease HigB of HigAB toxin-antitoxin module